MDGVREGGMCVLMFDSIDGLIDGCFVCFVGSIYGWVDG